MCIFCQIVAGDIPCYKIYEDKKVLAFLDINPLNPGHTLIIPKHHYQNLEQIPAKELTYLILIVKKLGKRLKERLGVEGYAVSMNNDPVAGQEVPHVHFHLIPRATNDGLTTWPRKQYKEGEAEKIAKKLRGEI